MEGKQEQTNYRWYIITLSALTNALAVAAPGMALAVLFSEITAELNLTVVQIGIIWGIGNLPAIIMGLLGGTLSDRIGTKRILIIACLFVALAGGARGLSTDFYSLAATNFLLGLGAPIIIMNNIKNSRLWFSDKRLGLAGGIVTLGMALGFLIGSLISATLLSPLLGGWRNVFFFYAVLSALLALPWYFSRRAADDHPHALKGGPASIWSGLRYVARLKDLWLLGLAVLLVNGAFQSVVGYLPLHLRSLGWDNINADGAVSVFHLCSMLFSLPIATISDRLGSRKQALIGAAIVAAIGIGLLAVFRGGAVWAAVILAGMVRDGFMAVLFTMTVATRGVSLSYASTATGFVIIFNGVGNVLTPPLGNSLAAVSSGAPFIFWSALCLVGIACITLIGRTQPAPAAAD